MLGTGMAWFGQVQASGNNRIKLMTSAGLGQAELEALNFYLQTAKTSHELIKTAIQHRAAVAVRNIFTGANTNAGARRQPGLATHLLWFCHCPAENPLPAFW
jgi:hypothetical protein